MKDNKYILVQIVFTKLFYIKATSYIVGTLDEFIEIIVKASWGREKKMMIINFPSHRWTSICFKSNTSLERSKEPWCFGMLAQILDRNCAPKLQPKACCISLALTLKGRIRYFFTSQMPKPHPVCAHTIPVYWWPCRLEGEITVPFIPWVAVLWSLPLKSGSNKCLWRLSMTCWLYIYFLF